MSGVFEVSDGGQDAFSGRAVQRAVEEASTAGGGLVKVPAGVYWLDNAIRLRSGVRLCGEKGAVFMKRPSVSSRLVDYLGYGHYEVTVENPEWFDTGMGIHVLDDNAPGFYTTVATITGVEGNRLFIDRMLNHDYNPDKNGRVVSAFSLIEVDCAADVMIENLTLDGNGTEEPFELNGCRGGGLFIYQSRRIRASGIEIRNYRGDAVSFQQNIGVTIENCEIHHNTGGGLHPGSGSVGYRMEGNAIHDNGGCGIFYCLRTTHSICRRNLIERNAGEGISIGERDTDHLIDENTIQGQGGAGILFRTPHRHGGDRVRVENNRVRGNGLQTGDAEIEIKSGINWVFLKNNELAPDKNAALRAGEGGSHLYAVGNRLADDRLLDPSDVTGDGARVQFETPDDFPQVGPDALPPDGARHLGC